MSAADVAAWSEPVPALEELGAVHLVGIGESSPAPQPAKRDGHSIPSGGR